MDVRGYLVRVSDGKIDRHTILLAPDLHFARLKAVVQFKGTRWLVRMVTEIAH